MKSSRGLFLHAAGVGALGEVLLDEGIDDQDRDDGADDQGEDHRVGRVVLGPGGQLLQVGVLLQLVPDEILFKSIYLLYLYIFKSLHLIRKTGLKFIKLDTFFILLNFLIKF